MRLQKYLAGAGVASRRKSEEYILQGRVKINNKVITELGTTVKPGDQVEVDGKPITMEEENVYYLLNKPIGYITSAADEKGRETVLDLLKDVKERVFPVGRLDYNTSGLLVLTNDGELTYELTHPKHHVEKTYIVKVRGFVEPENIARLQKGVRIDNYTTSPAKVKQIRNTPTTTTLSITIYEGRNRQVRKMCEAIGHQVSKLERVALGDLKLGKLPIGEYRKLTQEEVKYLKGLGQRDAR